MGPSDHRHFVIKRPFKAKKVTFWEVCRDFANSALFAAKLNFRRDFKNFCIFRFPAPKISFSAPGPPKKLPERYVYEGFCAGGAEVQFWPKRALLGSEPPKRAAFQDFGRQRAGHSQKGVVTLKKVKYFLGNTGCFDMSKIMIFMKFPQIS